MRRTRTRMIGTGIGLAVGLALGIAYWFLWGCDRCAKGQQPVVVVGVCVGIGALLGYRWSRDYDVTA